MAAGASPIRRQDDEHGRAAAGGGPSRLTPLRELQLVEAFKAGGQQAREALSELLWAYQRRIYSICFRMVGSQDEASDLTQDVLLKLMEGLEGFGGRSKLSTWVIRVTMNCCLSHIRRNKIREHASLDDLASRAGQDRGEAGSGAVASGGAAGRLKGRELSPANRVEQAQARDLVARALGMLDEDTRAILVMRDLQDLDYQQLAEALEMPLGTVKSRLFRARAALRQAVESLDR